MRPTSLLPDQQKFHQHLRELACGAIRIVLEGVMRQELDALIGLGREAFSARALADPLGAKKRRAEGKLKQPGEPERSGKSRSVLGAG